MKKIELKTFVEKYNSMATDALKGKYIKDNIEVVGYIPYLTKVAIMDKIIELSSYARDENGEMVIPRRLKLNSATRYLLFVTTLIREYTNIKIDTETPLHEQFDLLNEAGLVDVLIAKIPETEAAECKTILNMILEDLMTNEFETKSFISNQIDKFTDVANYVLEPLVEKISKIDPEKIEKALTKLADSNLDPTTIKKTIDLLSKVSK